MAEAQELETAQMVSNLAYLLIITALLCFLIWDFIKAELLYCLKRILPKTRQIKKKLIHPAAPFQIFPLLLMKLTCSAL
ncbi:MAG: hypothetical protein R2830_06215 [Saprospiraceae bacterium]